MLLGYAFYAGTVAALGGAIADDSSTLKILNFLKVAHSMEKTVQINIMIRYGGTTSVAVTSHLGVWKG